MLTTTLFLACALAALMLAAQYVAVHYLARLPEAPACPDCHAVTRAHGPATALDRLCALAYATPVRLCARCGWAGRMRWRLATERADSRRG
jgi:hypothetical protein